MQKRISLDKEIKKKVLKLFPVEYRSIICVLFLLVRQFFGIFFPTAIRKVSENQECRIAQKRISLDKEIKKSLAAYLRGIQVDYRTQLKESSLQFKEFSSASSNDLKMSFLNMLVFSTDYGHLKGKSLILCALRPKFKSQSQIDVWDLDIKAQFFVEILVD